MPQAQLVKNIWGKNVYDWHYGGKFLRAFSFFLSLLQDKVASLNAGEEV